VCVEKKEVVLIESLLGTFEFYNSKEDLADIKGSKGDCKYLTINLNSSISAWSGSIAIQHDKNTTSTASKPATILSR